MCREQYRKNEQNGDANQADHPNSLIIVIMSSLFYRAKVKFAEYVI
ncbi:hypothetical protein GPLA_3081 [Paraglaciecola polaris LMG 21857]|uniref:Uncharacterized protein n=1 Tax=Paraglaciecola polaris LMG 21857 TaxID=1129793 RepID=K6ZUL3_9ALTE|nr:hypothetical protein GPLA_3081 [Paraglaciecola polaris LMG 21857]